jgi:hypothetical protein
VGLSDTASDTIVQCYVGQACPTGLSDMGLDNSVRCHVKQTWFNGFVQHGIGQLCPIQCRTTGFDEFVRHGMKKDPGNPRYRWVMIMYEFFLIFSKWYSLNWYELGLELKRVLTKHWSNV